MSFDIFSGRTIWKSMYFSHNSNTCQLTKGKVTKFILILVSGQVSIKLNIISAVMACDVVHGSL